MLKIYSKPHCAFCDRAKNYLRDMDIDFVEVDIEKNQEALLFIKEQGHKTVPQLYVDDELFVEGGWQGLSKMTREQVLDKIQGKT
jgi:glutaredoxin 3